MSTDIGGRNCEVSKPGQGDDSAICNFKPDYELSTPRAQQWAADSQVQRSKPLDLDDNGCYKVKWGDCLSTIAERALKGSGAAVNRDSLQQMEDAIIQANHDRYKTLDCNHHFVKEGWNLKIPGTQVEERPPVQPEPPIKVEPLPPVQEPPRRLPCPPEQRPERPMPPDVMNMPRPRMPVIINEPDGVINIFINGGRGRQDWGRPDCNNQNWGRQRDNNQWSGDYDMPRDIYRPQPYRPDYDYQPYRPEPIRPGCSPCEQRQMYHNMRMPQVIRRNPVYNRY